MNGTALLVHSGGPTPVINASLLGLVEQAWKQPFCRHFYGSRWGIEGILQRDFVDLGRQSGEALIAVAHAPGSALGTSRRAVTPADVEQIIAVLRAKDIRYLFYTGGNGSMGTALMIAEAASSLRYDLHVIGVPKTIDNDLVETDHSPGFGSTARFFASALRDIGEDNRSLPGQVEFVEVLGRNTGWLVAASALGKQELDDPPHLVYFPEQPLPLERLLGDVERVYARLRRCVVAVCEGQLDEHGEPFGADVRSGSRGALAMNVAHRLAMLVSEKLKFRTRSEKPGLLGRSSVDFVSPVDWQESRECGVAAARAARGGETGKMVALQRGNAASYSMVTTLVPLEKVALEERLFPSEWRNSEDGFVSTQFRNYATPLIGDLQRHARLTDITPNREENERGEQNES